jgi:DNA-binding CsgD family transcriptional regulator
MAGGKSSTCDVPAQENQLFPGREYQSTVPWFVRPRPYCPLMEERNPTDRLTEREKECLRLWLEHKTAKEIALDLGISHFAVEKRLKMARTKLDVTTSLEAARMLADQEGYDQPVPQLADLEISSTKPDRWFSGPLNVGSSCDEHSCGGPAGLDTANQSLGNTRLRD